MVLPAPGRPMIRRLCATGGRCLERLVGPALPAHLGEVDLRRLCGGFDHPDIDLGRVPRPLWRNRATSASVAAAYDPERTRSALLVARSRPEPRRRSGPARAAAIATERMPGVGSNSPLRDSSPANAYPHDGRSGHLGRRGKDADGEGEDRVPDRPCGGLPARGSSTTRRSGHSRPALSTAGRTRSRASFTEAPGRPVKTNDG